MKTLIVEDDPTCSILLQTILQEYGPVQTAGNGRQAVEVVKESLDKKEPFNLICMDIMMPEMNGQQAVAAIRAMEEAREIFSNGATIIMITSIDDEESAKTAYSNFCDLYVVKPIEKAPLLEELRKLGLIR